MGRWASLPALFLLVLAVLGLVMPGARAGNGSDDARLLFIDVCRQLEDFKAGGLQGDGAEAAWEDTVHYLGERFGNLPLRALVLPPSARLEGKAVWGVSSLRGRHSRRIRVTWDKERGKLDVEISGDASGKRLGESKTPVGHYIQRFQVDVVQERDRNGNLVLRMRLPTKMKLESFVEECDEKGFLTGPNQVDLNGTWNSSKGKWIISHPPLRCGDPQAEITLVLIRESGYKAEFMGVIRAWVIKARHVITHPDAIGSKLPFKIRQILAAARKYPFDVELTVRRGRHGAFYLNGTWKGLMVTWNPDEMVVKKVFPGYQTPLVLVREAPKGGYRIVRIEVDTWGWESKLADLKTSISRLEQELKRYRDKKQEARSRFTALDKKRRGLEQEMGRAAKDIAHLEYRLRILEARLAEKEVRPEGPLPWPLPGLFDYKADLEKKLEEISKVAYPKQFDEWERDLEKVNRQIQREYSKIGFDPEKKRAQMKEERRQIKDKLPKLKDRYWDLKKGLAHLDGDMESVAAVILCHQKHINELEVKITDLRQKCRGLDERDTPFVDTVSVRNAENEGIGRWVKWAPLDAIDRINDETERLHRLLVEAGEVKERAKERFNKAGQDARRALDEVSKAVMNSAYLQAGIESGYYLYDVFGKGWQKGGPLGALTEALGKAAEACVMGGIKFAEANPRKIEERIQERYGLKPDYLSDVNMGKIKSAAAKRVLKETIFRKGKQKMNQHVMARVQQYLVDHMTDNLIKGIKKGLPVQVLEKQSRMIVEYNDYLDNLRSAKPYQLKNFAKGLFKDLSKTVLKSLAKGVEERAWINYFEKDIWARMCLASFLQAKKTYWDVYDQYMVWRELREKLVENYDPESGFKGPKSALLEEGKAYLIQLRLRSPRGRREEVFLGGKKATPVGDPDAHRFRVVVRDLQASRYGDVVLKIQFTE